MGDAVADRERPPWRYTVAVQAALCLALYAAFRLGEPQLIPRVGVDALRRGARGGGGGVAFLSVAGGARGPIEQARLLRQVSAYTYMRRSKIGISITMPLDLPGSWDHCTCVCAFQLVAHVPPDHAFTMETIAKAYEVKFVLDVAQLGEDDPFWQNGSMYFKALNIPWYSTKSSHGRTVGNFLKKVKMPYNQVLHIIGLDTWPLQEPLHDGKISTSYRGQTKWLDQSLELTDSNWKIVVGCNPLLVCNGEETPETTKLSVPIQRIFAKYEVNAYISMGGFCGYFHRDNSILYIGHPSRGVDQTSVDVFFLHRVRPLEMESMLINVEGKLVQRSVVQQYGTGAM